MSALSGPTMPCFGADEAGMTGFKVYNDWKRSQIHDHGHEVFCSRTIENSEFSHIFSVYAGLNPAADRSTKSSFPKIPKGRRTNFHRLPRSIPSIRENSLPSDPTPRSTQKRHNGSNVCNLRQSTLHRHGFVERNSVVRFLRVEECCRLDRIVSIDRQNI